MSLNLYEGLKSQLHQFLHVLSILACAIYFTLKSLSRFSHYIYYKCNRKHIIGCLDLLFDVKSEVCRTFK